MDPVTSLCHFPDLLPSDAASEISTPAVFFCPESNNLKHVSTLDQRSYLQLIEEWNGGGAVKVQNGDLSIFSKASKTPRLFRIIRSDWFMFYKLLYVQSMYFYMYTIDLIINYLINYQITFFYIYLCSFIHYLVLLDEYVKHLNRYTHVHTHDFSIFN